MNRLAPHLAAIALVAVVAALAKGSIALCGACLVQDLPFLAHPLVTITVVTAVVAVAGRHGRRPRRPIAPAVAEPVAGLGAAR